MYSNILLEKMPKNYFKYILISIILIINTFIFLFIFKSYDVKNIKMKCICQDICYYQTESLEDNISFILKADKVKIKNEDYKFKIDTIGDINIDYINNITYQNIKIKIDNAKCLNNSIWDVKFYGNQMRIIKKISKKIMN